MDDPVRGGNDWTGWLIPGTALAAAVALLVFTLLPRGEPVASPSPRPSLPTAVPSDEHEVVTDEGVLSFRLEVAQIVVRLTADGTTRELGRATLPFFDLPSGGTPVPTGSSSFAMVCPPAGAAVARRYVFGHLDAASGITYTGPEADGHGAPDGLFLFALLPDEPSGPVTVTSPSGSSVGFGPGAFDDAFADGQRQPSGCFVLG